MSSAFLLQPLRRRGLLPVQIAQQNCSDAFSERYLLQRCVDLGQMSWEQILEVLETEWAIPWKRRADWPDDWLDRLPVKLRHEAGNSQVIINRRNGIWEVIAAHPSALARFTDSGALADSQWQPYLTLIGDSARVSQLSMTVGEPSGSAGFGDPLQQLLEQSDSPSITDIHLEPLEGGRGRVRRRCDGRMMDYGSWDSARWKRLMASLLHRAHLPADQIRYPQESRIEAADRSFRVSLVPSLRGPAAVLRQLPHADEKHTLASLGMNSEMLERWNRLIATTQGLLLVVGPTGAGKSTTVRTLLHSADPNRRKILSLEDPVEVRIPGVQQIQVGETGKMSFADGIRSALRQCPDILFFGEIRDAESAAAALEASLTGHLVISTIHARSLTGAVWRLIELGQPPVNLASQLSALLSQRLVRLEQGGRSALFADWLPDDADRTAIRAQTLPLRSAKDDFDSAQKANHWHSGHLRGLH